MTARENVTVSRINDCRNDVGRVFNSFSMGEAVFHRIPIARCEFSISLPRGVRLSLTFPLACYFLKETAFFDDFGIGDIFQRRGVLWSVCFWSV